MRHRGERWPLGDEPIEPWEDLAQDVRKTAVWSAHALSKDPGRTVTNQRALRALAELGERHDEYRHHGGWRIVDEALMVKMRDHIRALEDFVHVVAKSRGMEGADVEWLMCDIREAIESEADERS